MTTQFALWKNPIDPAKAITFPGVSEVHTLVPGNPDDYATLVVLRGPDADFLAKTCAVLSKEIPLVLTASGSQSALDPNLLTTPTAETAR